MQQNEKGTILKWSKNLNRLNFSKDDIQMADKISEV